MNHHNPSRMKKSILVVTLLVSSAGLWSACTEILEPDPKSFTSTANFYETEEDMVSAVNGAYNRLRTQAGISNVHFNFWNEIRSDVINRHFNVNHQCIEVKPITVLFVALNYRWIYHLRSHN